MIKVSVVMITYNHEKFIKQAIEGVLMQKATFDFELIIANDHSTDNTNSYIEQVLNEHPEALKVKYYNRYQNLGMYGNVTDAFGKCSGKHIALCEGDDYWTDPYKLQKQVDFLEANPEFEVCFTNIKIIRADGSTKTEQFIPEGRKDVYEQKDLPIWAPTLTRVFRNRNFSGKLPDATGLDTVMLLYQSQFGKIKFINEVTGVYRMHPGGIHSSKSETEKTVRMIQTDLCSLDIVPPYLLPKYFGMLFKKLIGLKPLDDQLFIQYKLELKHSFQLYAPKINRTSRIKIKSLFQLLNTLPLFQHKRYRTFLFRIITKILIYR